MKFRMIRLTRLNHSEILVNPDLIEHVELNSDTVVTLTNGISFVVRETADQIVDRIVAFKRNIFQAPVTFGSDNIAAGRQEV